MPPNKNNLRADLHIHTFYSDGTYSPEEVVLRAKQTKLSAISITDHDSVAGLEAALAAAGSDLEVISGVELTVAFKERELHLLGYGFRRDDPDLKAFLSKMSSYREERIHAMIGRLAGQGVVVSLEEVKKAAGRGIMGRPHLAKVLLDRGVVSTFDQAFDRYLGDRACCFVKGATLTIPKAVELIRAAGGVTSLAHPFRLIQDSWIPDLFGCGIQGIEVYHSDHSGAVMKRYRKLAAERNLLVTGGSDCHGDMKEGGCPIGSVAVSYEEVERLKNALGR